MVKNIFKTVNAKGGVDFSSYSSEFLERTVKNRMEAVGEREIRLYVELIKNNDQERRLLSGATRIRNSEFFRDPYVFAFVEKKILPKIVAEKHRSGIRDIRVWSAGCATGEEPYSIAILLSELVRSNTKKLNISLFATDIDDNALEFAQKGVYDIAKLNNMRYSLLNKYFKIADGMYRITDEVRQYVVFSKFDMLQSTRMAPEESVFASFDIVFCRNLLIYVNKKGKDDILKKLYYTTASGGYLVLGDCEMLDGEQNHLFELIDEDAHVYQKL